MIIMGCPPFFVSIYPFDTIFDSSMYVEYR